MRLAMIHQKPYLLTKTGFAQPIFNHESLTEALAAGRNSWQLGGETAVQAAEFTAPIPSPRQIFAIGMNYRDHAKEISLALPKTPSIFTKYPSSIAGPEAVVKRHGPQTDWETELVVVIGRGGRDIAPEDAAKHIAGYVVGEDISDRQVQFANQPAQFSLGKSCENFAPIGPWLTTPEAVPDLMDQTLTTKVNGRVMQQAKLNLMVFDPAHLLSYLSSIVALYPGDLIFTGTPQGTGAGHKPPIFLQPGDQVAASIEKLGSLHLTIA